jgi:hypothetical protein
MYFRCKLVNVCKKGYPGRSSQKPNNIKMFRELVIQWSKFRIKFQKNNPSFQFFLLLFSTPAWGCHT